MSSVGTSPRALRTKRRLGSSHKWVGPQLSAVKKEEIAGIAVSGVKMRECLNALDRYVRPLAGVNGGETKGGSSCGGDSMVLSSWSCVKSYKYQL
jgi:hypothetical protein